MAEYLTQNLVNLSSRGFRPNRTPKLGFYHAESSLSIRPLMIMLQENVPIEVIEMPHAIPQTIKFMMMVAHASGTDFKGDKGHSAYGLYGMKVLPARIGFVGGDLIDIECLGCSIYQGGELQVVSRFVWGCLNTRNNMSFDTTHQMGFYPCLLAALLAIFVVEPPGICGSSESRGINGEVGFNCSQRAGTLLNEAFQQGCQFGILQIAEGAVIMGSFRNQPVFLSFFQPSGESPPRHGCIGLGHESEYNISQWQAGTPEPIFWLWNAITEVTEQGNKMFLLVRLCLIIGSPVLSISYPHCFGYNFGAIRTVLSLDNELNRINMLALFVSSLKMPTGTEWFSIVHIHDVSSITRLRRDFPAQFVFLNRVRIRYCQPSFLPYFHFVAPHTITSICIYYTIQCMALSIPFEKIFLILPMDNGIHRVVNYRQMGDEIRAKLAELLEKDWTLANIARALGQATVTVESWNQGRRSPANLQSVLASLDVLAKQKRIPKKKIYAKKVRNGGK